jgi:hypothetical protein
VRDTKTGILSQWREPKELVSSPPLLNIIEILYLTKKSTAAPRVAEEETPYLGIFNTG